MRSRTVRLIAIAGWAGVALDALLLIQTAWPGSGVQWALSPLSPLLPHRRAVQAAAFALLLAAGLLDGVGRAVADLPRHTAPPPAEGELRWSQPYAGLRGSDWFARAMALYAGALPALFVLSALLLFLLAPERRLLLLVVLLARFPARRLGRWAAMRWLVRRSPHAVGVLPRGVMGAATLLPWEALSCFEVGPAQGRFLVFGRPFPRPPLIVLEAPPALAGPVHAALRAHLPEATAAESVAWRRNEAAWVAQLSVPFLAACAAVASAFLLADRNLACAGLALTFLLCERWFWGLAGRLMGLAPAPRLPEPAFTETVSTPHAGPSRTLKAVSRLSTALFALGCAGWVCLDLGLWPAWQYRSGLVWASDVFVALGVLLSIVEIRMRKQEPSKPSDASLHPRGEDR